MFDIVKLQECLLGYKKGFIQRWGDEKYKWEAVRWFQNNWDVNAPDFAEMLTRSLARTYNLLASMNNFPARMIQGFAKVAPEEVRAMFIALFDESKDVVERILEFKDLSSVMLERYGGGAAQHYQYENAISVYLWLRYPDKYYIYKYGEVRSVAEKLGSDHRFKKGAYVENLRHFFAFYDELRAELKKDGGLIALMESQLTEDCYHDAELSALTVDVGFYISRCHSAPKSDGHDGEIWLPSDYSPELTVEDWSVLLNDADVFTVESLEIMKRMKDYGGQATCKQLSVKYGGSVNMYLDGSVSLAKRVAEKTGCPIMPENVKNYRWWPVLYLGKYARKDEDSIFCWKLRPELLEALDKADLSGVELYVKAGTGEYERNYWFLNANPRIWSFSSLSVGDVQSYTLYNENGNKRRIFQNFLDAKVGDLVIGYESTPVKQIVAVGRVSAEQDGEKIYFEKLEGLSSPIDFATLRDCAELSKMEYFSMQQGSLFKLTKGEYDFIIDMIREKDPLETVVGAEKYDKQRFLDEVFMTESRYDTMVAVLKNKKNIILQGAPGVGKTFAAKRLAYSIMGEKDEDRIEFVQFHQNYSYEDLVMGYKPADDGFELKYGIFYRFCQKAATQPGKDHFFIIDEINRGNMSKIFGELLMLIERDHRGEKVTMAYNGMAFSVPENLYIIGMMNTADRSLAMIDYALRRRFSFFELEPGFGTEGFLKYQHSLRDETFSSLVSKVQELNKEIAADKSLGKGFCIGHSYFCGCESCTDEWMRTIVDYEILPMLSEYWFDDVGKLQRWENILHGVFQ